MEIKNKKTTTNKRQIPVNGGIFKSDLRVNDPGIAQNEGGKLSWRSTIAWTLTLMFFETSLASAFYLAFTLL